MRINSVVIQPYQTSYTGLDFKLKVGARVSFEFSNGLKSQGDLCPLPGFSRETIEDAIEELAQINGLTIEEALKFLQFPSSQFCLKMSLLPPSYFPPKSATLHFPGTPLTLSPILKLKLKDLSLNESIALVESIPKEIKLRLDFNRAWSKEDVAIFFQSINLNQIDFIEEPPIIPPKEIPFAIDESLRDLKMMDQKYHQCSHIVVKPVLQTNFESVIEDGQKNRKKIIISSSFESPLGMQGLWRIIKKYRLFDLFHGLDTLKYQVNQKHSSSHSM